MKKLKKLHALIALAFMTLLVISCDFKGITDDVDIQISNNILKQEALISVLDIVNPESIEGPNKLTVELIGDDADKFVTNSGEKISNLKVIDGNISLAVNPNFSSSEDLKVLLKIKGDNYLTTTIPVIIAANDTLVTKSINIVNKLNTVQGVDFIETTKTLSNNSISENYIITTPKTKATTNTEITIESGTIFQDANGNNISGANLKSEIAHFSLDTPEAIASFPGGLTPLSVIDETGEETEDVAFITAGFTSIDMFVDGKEVKNFSKPISVGIEIPNNYINPETGDNISEGDLIPIWSYGEDGQWGFHKTGTVTMNTSGNYNVAFTTTHLSWYNLDYYYRGCDYYRKLTVSIPKTPSLSDNFNNLSYDLVYAHNGQVIANRDIQISKTKDNSNGYYRTPNQNLKIKLYSGSRYDSNRVLLYTSDTFDGCSNNTINIDGSTFSNSIPPKPDVRNINIQFQAKCGDKVLNPFLYLYRQESYTYYGRTYTYWRWVGYTYAGKGYIYNAHIGVSQKYKVYFGGNSYEYDYTFNSDNIIIGDFEAPGDLCSRLF
ncbi:hypothetical protein [Polaribacter sp. HaHaR_3_91]|jgi:hypothetical protein|uniref:hypothetical protein n=1 Tax=Polaribacter sp. HaHaR_3_91 TaxID=2745561 RepID=UPI001C4F0E45|nr:hypothetical protein [Polaribacter sp. HaHaR_3_91]QXP64667.1 hypothetical protein H0I27_05640 [Polaribacter sp. HaHaR_3_91]